jgi:hypothetical protein
MHSPPFNLERIKFRAKQKEMKEEYQLGYLTLAIFDFKRCQQTHKKSQLFSLNSSKSTKVQLRLAAVN